MDGIKLDDVKASWWESKYKNKYKYHMSHSQDHSKQDHSQQDHSKQDHSKQDTPQLITICIQQTTLLWFKDIVNINSIVVTGSD